jgi:hypothetical protein
MVEGHTFIQGEMEVSKGEEWISKGNGQRSPCSTKEYSFFWNNFFYCIILTGCSVMPHNSPWMVKNSSFVMGHRLQRTMDETMTVTKFNHKQTSLATQVEALQHDLEHCGRSNFLDWYFDRDTLAWNSEVEHCLDGDCWHREEMAAGMRKSCFTAHLIQGGISAYFLPIETHSVLTNGVLTDMRVKGWG